MVALLAVGVALLSACGQSETKSGRSGNSQKSGQNRIVLALLGESGERLTGEVTANVAASIRARMEALGFSELVISPKSGNRLVVQYGKAPINSESLLRQAFLKQGQLQIRALHPNSRALVSDLRGLNEAGPDWGILRDQNGQSHVVAESALINPSQIGTISRADHPSGDGTPVVEIQFRREAQATLDGLRATIEASPLAVVVDDQVLAAPISPSRLSGLSLVLGDALTDTDANELIFILRSPLVVPLQRVDAEAM